LPPLCIEILSEPFPNIGQSVKLKAQDRIPTGWDVSRQPPMLEAEKPCSENDEET
jgi:hypothetical protein